MIKPVGRGRRLNWSVILTIFNLLRVNGQNRVGGCFQTFWRHYLAAGLDNRTFAHSHIAQFCSFQECDFAISLFVALFKSAIVGSHFFVALFQISESHFFRSLKRAIAHFKKRTIVQPCLVVLRLWPLCCLDCFRQHLAKIDPDSYVTACGWWKASIL